MVDDNAMIRAHLRNILELREEWVVVGEACNGRHAVETCHEHRPHVTVMDRAMPVMGGLEAARHLTRLHPHIPILMMRAPEARQDPSQTSPPR